MALAFSGPLESPALRAFLDDQLPRPDSLVLDIHEDDEMFLGARAVGMGLDAIATVSYFKAGHQLSQIIRQIAAWRFGGFDGVGALLDFACGYGRLTRFLALNLPPERIWASDIYAGGVAFVERTFGVHGVVSATDPAEFRLDQRFDLIVVPSLFSHLPDRRFVPRLRRLHGLLSARGVLAFSVQDEALLAPGERMPEAGIRFDAASESRTLDTTEYGNTLVTERYVGRAIVEAAAGQAAWRRWPRAFGHVQDLYLIVPEAGESFEGLVFRHGPRGFLDAVGEPSLARLSLAGWAADPTPGQEGVEVHVQLNGERRAVCRPGARRDDVARHYRDPRYLQSGWSCLLDAPAPIDRERDVLLIKAVSPNGDCYVVHSSTVADAVRFLERQREEARRAELLRRQVAIMTSRSGLSRLGAIVAFHYYRAGPLAVVGRVPGYLKKQLLRLWPGW